ncbi:type III secretion system translocon subunit SctE [Chromobacterium vaccinii]|uniref:type III secretion system translocon subunit SctE n=1 Tax=Chromobacterium vaccinii TaxID=1108595 RepID=UPI001E312208|nr:type III secretion system translocon subunit SctE [Chromobacterium vaccinii]MCD4498794.1 type III secretion system translocon subunit SctE [Chromobacterium vaccinii]
MSSIDSINPNVNYPPEHQRILNVISDKVRKPGSFIDTIHLSTVGVLNYKETNTEWGGEKPRTSTSVPDLTSPTPKAKSELDKGGMLVKIIGELIRLLGNINIQRLEAQLGVWKALMESQRLAGEKSSQEFTNLVNDSDKATQEFKQKNEAAQNDQNAADKAKSERDAAKDKLNGLAENDPEYGKVKAAYDSSEAAYKTAQGKADASAGDAAAAGKVANEKANLANKKYSEIINTNGNSEIVKDGAKLHLTNMAQLTAQLAEFSKLVGENAERSLNNDLALFKAMQESRQKEMEKKSEDFQKEEKKSEALGCLGKILGFILAAVSVVGAIFTGGASLALAAVGLGLMVADEVGKAITGKSFMEAAMKPLMDAILKPLMEALSKMISKMLESFGVSKDTAEMVGHIVGGIIAAIAMVAVMALVATVGKSIASKMGDVIGKLITDEMKNLVPQVLKNLSSGISKGFSRVMQKGKDFLASQKNMPAGLDEAQKLEWQTLRVKKMTNYSQGVLAVADSATSGARGVAEKKKSDALADIVLGRAELDKIKQWMNEAVETYGASFKIGQDLIATISSSLKQNEDAGRHVLRHSHA